MSNILTFFLFVICQKMKKCQGSVNGTDLVIIRNETIKFLSICLYHLNL